MSFAATRRPIRLIVAGSASIHTWRYIQSIAPYVQDILLVGGGDIPKIYRPSNLVSQLPATFAFSSYRLADAIRTWLKPHLPNLHEQLPRVLLHIHQANSVAWHLMRATRGMGIPTLLTCYGSDVLMSHQSYLRHQLLKYYLKQAHHVTVASYEMARIVSPYLKEVSALTVVNFGVTMPHRIARKGRYVLSSRLHKPLYRIDAILHAWQAVEKIHPDWRLIVAGEGDETPALKALVASLQLKQVAFVGWVSEPVLQKLYKKSAVYVSVPMSDAVSLSLFEAMGHGCLPVVSNIAANLEAIQDGFNGIVHPNSNLSGLSHTLLQAIEKVQTPISTHTWVTRNRAMVRALGLRRVALARFLAIYDQLCLT